MKTIHVSASKEYDVLVERGLLHRCGALIRGVCRGQSAAVVADETVWALYGEVVSKSLRESGFRVICCTFPAGEQEKTLETYAAVIRTLAAEKMSRSDCVIALGGGVTGDLAGFVAASYMRGIDFVQIPTTLLAAVDSSVGGKTAVDLDEGKNLVGAFYQPRLVLCDPDTLATLPPEQFRAGMAEVIKYGMIGDEDFLNSLLARPAAEHLEEVIAACVAMKRDVVSRDEFEQGERRLLNFGHTVGHAVERCRGFALSHGEAVAIGMAVLSRAAANKGYCSEETLTRLLQALQQYDLPMETDCTVEELSAAALADKKRSGDKLRLVVPERVGKCRIETIAADSFHEWLKAGGVQ
ncbi:MAG: 3-dehydroquinate synthase [Oscillospiraceae bacterium]|nr:3-dehydroquinate synthase [Oscillospiraceae bacterium]